jgi:HemY protein
MRFLFYALLVLGAVIGFTLVAQRDPGYVLINYAGWSVESSFSVLLLVLVVSLFAFHFTLRLLSGTLHLPQRMAYWHRHRRAIRSRRLTNQGLIALAEGSWSRAEKKLSRAATHSDTPLINYLGAARAAQKQGEEQRRDDYLSQAYQSMPDAELAVGLTQADVQLSQGQAEQALATLRHLRSIAPKHVYVLYLLKKLYEHLQSWDELHQLLPELHKYHVLEEKEYNALEHHIFTMLLHRSDTLDTLNEVWQQLPKRLHQDAALLHEYAQKQQQLGAEEQAEATLYEFLKKHWDPDLIRLYGMLRGSDSNRQLATAEHWLQEHEHHPELLLTLGRLSLHNQLWGKARSYLEASMGMDPRPETCCELGNLLYQLGEKEKATEYYRKGVELTSGEHCTRFEIPKHTDTLQPGQVTQTAISEGES